jgi:hypothetical protein
MMRLTLKKKEREEKVKDRLGRPKVGCCRKDNVRMLFGTLAILWFETKKLHEEVKDHFL